MGWVSKGLCFVSERGSVFQSYPLSCGTAAGGAPSTRSYCRVATRQVVQEQPDSTGLPFLGLNL